MATKTLVEKIESLPPEKRAEVEDFVEFLATRREELSGAPTFPKELLDRINTRREQLYREHGLFDTLPDIREFRETGGR